MSSIFGIHPEQIPTNAMLGELAYADDARTVRLKPGTGIREESVQNAIDELGRRTSVSGDYPTIRPAFIANFQNSPVLDPRIGFARASARTVYDRNGNLVTLANDVPAFGYDPATGRPLGLQMQGFSFNNLLWSEDFSKSPWIITAEGLVVSGDPGSQTLTETETSNALIYQPFAYVAGKDYVLRAIVSKSNVGQTRYAQVSFPPAAFGVERGIRLNLDTGELAQATGSPVARSGSRYLGNGKWEFYISDTATTDAVGWTRFNITNSMTGGTGYTGDGVSGLVLHGISLDEGIYPNAYIKTEDSVGAAVADRAQITGTDFTSWFNPNEGTFALSYSIDYLTETGQVIMLPFTLTRGVSYDDAIYVHGNDQSVPARSKLMVRQGGQQIVNLASQGFTTPGVPRTIAFSYDKTGVSFIFSGDSDVRRVDAVLSPFELDTLNLGANWNNNNNFLTGAIQNFVYYPRVVTPTQLEALVR